MLDTILYYKLLYTRVVTLHLLDQHSVHALLVEDWEF